MTKELDELGENIIKIVAENGPRGVRQRDIERAVQRSESTVRYRLIEMSLDGRIRLVRNTTGTFAYPAEPK